MVRLSGGDGTDRGTWRFNSFPFTGEARRAGGVVRHALRSRRPTQSRAVMATLRTQPLFIGKLQAGEIR